jgi:hypothetical protein
MWLKWEAQPALTYTSMNDSTVSISVNSELDAFVPEPATLALVGVALQA